MSEENYDNLILPKSGVKGDLRFARRLVGETSAKRLKREGNKKARRVTRQALKGNPREAERFFPVTSWDLT